MMKMHENELEIDVKLVQKLLQSQRAKWSHLPIARIQSSGTDNALFKLGDQYVVRLPRVEWSKNGIEHNISKEYKWLPQIAKLLQTSISEPVFKGVPSEDYPWSWVITKWCDGVNPDFEVNDEYAEFAIELAEFLNSFHAIQLEDGPASRRGVPLKQLDESTCKAINELDGEIDIQLVTALWEELISVPDWHKSPVWVHGDFLPGNILIQDGHLSGVIDFSDVGIGDPACDLVIAWALLNEKSRELFRSHLENIDDNTWLRGKGWALSIALIMLPYYKNTNAVLARLARRIIKTIVK